MTASKQLFKIEFERGAGKEPVWGHQIIILIDLEKKFRALRKTRSHLRSAHGCMHMLTEHFIFWNLHYKAAVNNFSRRLLKFRVVKFQSLEFPYARNC